MNRMRSALLVAALTVGTIAPALAQDRSADITFSGTGIAAGVGFTWGDGTLHFKGSDYRFTANGLSVADVGIAHIEGAGDVYNLHRVEDFSGNYVAAGAGATMAGGGDLAVLENQKGVRIYLRSTTLGLKLNLSADGVRVALK
jgi:hypothetical protein